MTTLTETAIFSRKAIKWFIAGTVVVIFLVIFLIFAGAVKNSIFVPEPIPATVAFGKIPRIDLSAGHKPSPNITYSLETITGDLPQLETHLKVFATAQSKVSFGDLERATNLAQKVGFTEPQQVSPGVVKFVSPTDSSKVLTMETASGNFTLSSNYLNNPRVITSKISNLEEAQERARRFLLALGVDGDEFPESKQEVKKLRIDGGGLTETQLISQANLIKVIFKRSDLDKFPVILPNVDNPPIFVLASAREIEQANVDIAKIQRYKFATYPLKSVQKAFQDLKDQKAAFNKPPASGQLIIKDVSLGYLEGKRGDPYLQPVYLFNGNNFIAYVPAVDDAWILEEPAR